MICKFFLRFLHVQLYLITMQHILTSFWFNVSIEVRACNESDLRGKEIKQNTEGLKVSFS